MKSCDKCKKSFKDPTVRSMQEVEVNDIRFDICDGCAIRLEEWFGKWK